MFVVAMDTRSRINPHLGGATPMSPESAMASDVFDQFLCAGTFKATLSTYRYLCEVLRIKPTNYSTFYPKLKAKLRSWKAASLWSKLDKRASHKCYNRGKACPNTRVLIIGAGPCGLRTAIEAQLLGAKVVVVEKRDRFSRNNVLHLWPIVIHDLRNLGAKKLFGKFCAGSIDHISIRQLQLILLKVALLLGVEVHENVTFKSLIEPPENQSHERVGWRAQVLPPDHPVSQYEFDVLVGADGKRNTLIGFNRKEFRGKLAIAITANFINRHTLEEQQVPEISGVAFIFNQKFFQDMKEQTGIDLENIVYYKDDTHYFVMTAKKQSLLERGVILNDYSDTARLLAPENVDRESLMEYARDAADFSTDGQLPTLDFAVNHYGQADVAMFDFTSMYAAEHACRVLERRGHKLLQALVGDSLLEPFWPTGSGCARGFLGSFDAAWMIRSWASGKMTPLQVLAEREAVYRLLAQTTPENLNKDFNQHTINPTSRYPNLNLQSVLPAQVKGLYDTDAEIIDQLPDVVADIPRKRRRRESIIHPDALLSWCKRQVVQHDNIKVENMTTSWKNGLALCAIIHRYRPDLIDLDSFNPEDVAKNNQLAFDICEREFGIPPVMTGQEMEDYEVPDKLTMVSYISQIYETFRGEIPHIVRPHKAGDISEQIPLQQTQNTTSFLSRFSQKLQSKKRHSLERDSSKEKSDSLKRNRIPFAMGNRRRSREKGISLDLSSPDTSQSSKRKVGSHERVPFSSRLKILEEKLNQNSGLQHGVGGDLSGNKRQLVGRLCQDEWSSRILEEQGRRQNADKKQAVKVGRLTKDEWNIKFWEDQMKEESKEKLQKTATGNRPKVMQEIFDERLKAMDAKLKAGGILEEEQVKFRDFDSNLKRLNKQLKEGSLTAGTGEINKVATITSRIFNTGKKTDIKGEVPLTSLLPTPNYPNVVTGDQVSTPSGGSEICYFCNKRVYLMERLSAQGFFFHRSCFKCEYCNGSLRLRNYAFDSTAACGGRFYCWSHYRMPKPDRRWQEMMKRKQAFLADSSAPNLLGKSPQKEQHPVSPIQEPEPPPHKEPKMTSVFARNVDNPDMAVLGSSSSETVLATPHLLPQPSSSIDVRDKTPERAEYENSLELSEEELLTSELEEEELTQKNLGPSQEIATSDDEFSDLSTDTESEEEEEAYAEELERSLTADETRKLAKTWQRRYSRDLLSDSETTDDEQSSTESLTETGGEDTSEDVDSNEEYSSYETSDDASEICSDDGKVPKAPEESKDVVVKVPVPDIPSQMKKKTEDLSSSEAEGSDSYTESLTSGETTNTGTDSETESEPEPPRHQIPTIVIDESPPQEAEEQEWVEDTAVAALKDVCKVEAKRNDEGNTSFSISNFSTLSSAISVSEDNTLVHPKESIDIEKVELKGKVVEEDTENIHISDVDPHVSYLVSDESRIKLDEDLQEDLKTEDSAVKPDNSTSFISDGGIFGSVKMYVNDDDHCNEEKQNDENNLEHLDLMDLNEYVKICDDAVNQKIIADKPKLESFANTQDNSVPLLELNYNKNLNDQFTLQDLVDEETVDKVKLTSPLPVKDQIKELLDFENGEEKSTRMASTHESTCEFESSYGDSIGIHQDALSFKNIRDNVCPPESIVTNSSIPFSSHAITDLMESNENGNVFVMTTDLVSGAELISKPEVEGLKIKDDTEIENVSLQNVLADTEMGVSSVGAIFGNQFPASATAKDEDSITYQQKISLMPTATDGHNFSLQILDNQSSNLEGSYISETNNGRNTIQQEELKYENEQSVSLNGFENINSHETNNKELSEDLAYISDQEILQNNLSDTEKGVSSVDVVFNQLSALDTATDDSNLSFQVLGAQSSGNCTSESKNGQNAIQQEQLYENEQLMSLKSFENVNSYETDTGLLIEGSICTSEQEDISNSVINTVEIKPPSLGLYSDHSSETDSDHEVNKEIDYSRCYIPFKSSVSSVNSESTSEEWLDSQSFVEVPENIYETPISKDYSDATVNVKNSLMLDELYSNIPETSHVHNLTKIILSPVMDTEEEQEFEQLNNISGFQECGNRSNDISDASLSFKRAQIETDNVYISPFVTIRDKTKQSKQAQNTFTWDSDNSFSTPWYATDFDTTISSSANEYNIPATSSKSSNEKPTREETELLCDKPTIKTLSRSEDSILSTPSISSEDSAAMKNSLSFKESTPLVKNESTSYLEKPSSSPVNSIKKDTKLKGYSGSFVEKVRPRSVSGDSLYLKSLDISLQKLKFPSLSKENVQLKGEDNKNVSLATEKSHEPSPLAPKCVPSRTVDDADRAKKLRLKRLHRRSLHDDIQGVPFADDEKSKLKDDVFYTPNSSFSKVDKEKPLEFDILTPSLTPTEEQGFTCVENQKLGQDLRLQRTVEQQKARQEARERAKLMSDEELGLSPYNCRKKINSLSEKGNVLYEELSSEELLDDDDEEEEEQLDFVDDNSSGTYRAKRVEILDPRDSHSTLVPLTKDVMTENTLSPTSAQQVMNESTQSSQFSETGTSEGLLSTLSPSSNESMKTSGTTSSSKSPSAVESSSKTDNSASYLESSVCTSDIDISIVLSKSSQQAENPDIQQSSDPNEVAKISMKPITKNDSILESEKPKSNGKKNILSLLTFAKHSPSKERTKEKTKEDSKERSASLPSTFQSKTPQKEKKFPRLKLSRTKEKSRDKHRNKYLISRNPETVEHYSSVSPEAASHLPVMKSQTKERSVELAKAKESLKQLEETARLKSGSLVAPKTSGTPSQTGIAPKASGFYAEDSFSDTEEETQNSKTQEPREEQGKKEKGAIDKERKARVIERVQRQQELKRLRTAQEIQRQLAELEVKQRDLEQQGVSVEKSLRGEATAHGKQKSETELMTEWFSLVHQKNKLAREEQELLIRAKDLELEDRHVRLQQEIRERMARNDSEKNRTEIEEEGKMLTEMLEIVKERDELVAMLDQLKVREEEEDRDLESKMLAKGLHLSPVSKS
ncbi:molecule interacting with CasL isoform X1 [Tachypleus tridentatus]|uniref:molecule interacting with CasL isoform X1 n=1 Tax=Tachypleus tridentatus TaxID=6853 RepID=UPI003FD4306F